MRVQKYPATNTYANTWPTLADVPAGVATDEMTGVEFAAWLAAQPPIVQPLPVPSPLPAWRIRTVLRRRGLFGQVNALIAKLPEPPRIVVEEQMESSQFERNHPIIEQFGAALGLSAADLDDIFREADALV